MKEYLNKIRSCIDGFDRDTLSTLHTISPLKTYKKGDFLLRQGAVCKYSFGIEKGMLRKFYLNDGKEITTEFFFQDDLAVSFESYALQKPGKECIQALTDTVVAQTSYTAFQKAKQNNLQLAALDLLLTEYYAAWLENRLFEFHTLNATQRYGLLLKNEPHMLQHIPLTYIASYLGISLETLSRIRAKI